MIFSNHSCKKEDEEELETENSLIDSRDGQVYRLVTIGTQKWFAQNLNCKTPNSYYYENDESTGNIYGRLYTWENAIHTCPEGWHLPNDSEWQTLVDYLGGEEVAGGKLKESGTALWYNSFPNIAGTNESGFTALPAGFRTREGLFASLGMFCYFWSTTQSGDDAANTWGLNYADDQVTWGHGADKLEGFSVRCIKDK